MSKREHWDAVYSRKAPDSVSWFQEHAASSAFDRREFPDLEEEDND